MSIEVITTGNGRRVGGPEAIANYSASEEATPINVASSRGAVGSIDVTVTTEDETFALLLQNDEIEVSDGSNGTTRGTIAGVSIADSGETTLSSDSRLGMLVASRDVKPFVGTLAEAIDYYFGLVGIDSDYFVEPSIADRPVEYPGWSGEVWLYLKQLCAVEGIETSLVSSNIITRPTRMRELDVLKQSSSSLVLDNADLALNVEVEYMEGEYSASPRVVYPSPGTTVTPYQVDPGGSLMVDVKVPMSVQTVEQPVAVNSVPADYAGNDSRYSVIDREANPVTAAQWEAAGGNIWVEVLPDTYTLRIHIEGARDARGPFRIAARVGGDASDTSTRSTLRIAAIGISAVTKTLVVPTGAPIEKTSRTAVATVKSPFIRTLTQAYDVASLVASAAARPSQTISAAATVVNRRGDSGSATYISFGDFTPLYPEPETFGEFDADWIGKTFGQFDDYIISLNKDSFQNQAFGNVAGARVRRGEAFYRVNSATVTPSDIRYQAEQDTLLGDFDAQWAGKTFGDFDAQWTGKTFDDHAVIPLWGGEFEEGTGQYPDLDIYPGLDVYPSEGE